MSFINFLFLFVPVVSMNRQGRSQEFATGDKRGGLGPPAGSRGRAPVESGGKAPEAGDKIANFQLQRLGYATVGGRGKP